MAKREFLKSGDLDTPIDVYYTTRTQNDYGELITSLNNSSKKTVWAKLLTTGTKGNEKIEDDTLRAESKINFLVRNDEAFYDLNSTSVSPEQKLVIKYQDKFWNVVSVEYQGRGLGIIIRCKFTDNEYPTLVF